jgi:CspA family cold shock protein
LGRARRLFGLACAVTEWRPGANGAIKAVAIANRNEHNMAEGTIKRLTDRGFGFIETSPGNDIFFHMSNVDGVRFEDLRQGQKVSFDEGQGPKGPRAENVRPL